MRLYRRLAKSSAFALRERSTGPAVDPDHDAPTAPDGSLISAMLVGRSFPGLCADECNAHYDQNFGHCVHYLSSPRILALRANQAWMRYQCPAGYITNSIELFALLMTDATRWRYDPTPQAGRRGIAFAWAQERGRIFPKHVGCVMASGSLHAWVFHYSFSKGQVSFMPWHTWCSRSEWVGYSLFQEI